MLQAKCHPRILRVNNTQDGVKNPYSARRGFWWSRRLWMLYPWHSTWFINSVTHLWGDRTFDTDDNLCNLWWAAILTYSEGWHNNQSSCPSSVAKVGWR